ncbi:MAG: lysophospholipid acyltransferase family protein [Anaerolineales bacterium]
MPDQSSSQPKPITDWWRPDLVALSPLTFMRKLTRAFLRGLMKLLAFLLLRMEIKGLEEFPRQGPAVIVFNHLGDADVVLLAAAFPIYLATEGIGKIELYDHWLVGPLFRAYGVIWIHRGQPDRKAIRAALDALEQRRMLILAPEGRQTVTGGLEEGTDGAAFLAIKSGAPIVPVAITGTENENIYGNFKRWKRPRVTLSVGEPFFIREQADRQGMMREGTRQIMESLANLLPESYRGIYKESENTE